MENLGFGLGDPGVRQRQPETGGVRDQPDEGAAARPTNVVFNEWANYQRNGFWTPSYSTEEAGFYRDSPGKEYVQALRKWQTEYMNYLNYQKWSQMMLPHTLSMMQMHQMHLQQQINQQSGATAGVGGRQQQQQQQQQGARNGLHQPRPDVQAPQPNAILNGHEFILPPLWKRLAAEFIDFLFLFIIKLGVTLLVAENGGLLDLEKYDIELLFTKELNYERALAMTSELIVLEIVTRVFVCIFETLCLRGGVRGQIGGATPGKRMFGLRVVSCVDVVQTAPNKVRVAPAKNIGIVNALVRSVIKNFTMAFFFPACLTVFFFTHNRAAYDIIAQSMVVELTEYDLRLGR